MLFLRKTSIDELPQLFNVLHGEMSLVGPRMITRPELDKYGDKRDMLLAVKPGMTGYWQVTGRQEVEYGDRVQMDMYYIKHWSLALDLQILVKDAVESPKARRSTLESNVEDSGNGWGWIRRIRLQL